MLSAASDTTLDVPMPVARPRGVTSAYGAVIRGTESPRDIEYRVLARATALLEAAARPGAGPAAMPEAVHENTMVWAAFAADLAAPGNAWDDATKARLISLAYWALAEGDRVMRDGKAPNALIDVNRAVMQGLKPDTAAPTDSR